MIKHISYSGWMQFRKVCQHRWKLDNLDGLKSKAYGVHMDFGTAVHESIENYRCRNPNPYFTVDVAVFYFKEKFRWLYSQHRELYKPKDLETPVDFFLDAGENIIRRLDECDELRNAEVLYNEHRLEVPIERDDMEVKFKGFIDMVIKTKDKRGNTILYVCDFKTCSWGWALEKKQDKELHFQILLYKHFLCKKFNLDPSQVRTAFILLKKRPFVDKKTGVAAPPVEWFPISAGPVSVQRAVDELNRDLTQIRLRAADGSFKKNRESCIDAFGEKCPYLNTPLCPNDK